MRTSRLLIPIVTLALAACQSNLIPLPFTPPTVRLHHLALRNAGLTGGTLDIVMAFYNPNRVRVSGTRLEAGLDIEKNHFGDVVLADAFQLTDRDTTLITVPLNFQWVGATMAARSVLNSGAVNYRINGKASVSNPLGQPLSVPFSGEGSVPLLHP
ncbi:MAG: hypothetical protein HY700_02425 [Gemmatimonadetes bacterium]|nr:hypothetical protein [Gemmatimonadota bacterium]